MATKALSWPELSCWPPSPFVAKSGCSSSALPALGAPLIWPARSELSTGHVVPEASSSSVRADKSERCSWFESFEECEGEDSLSNYSLVKEGGSYSEVL
jgi:hypothetical protein